MDNKWMKIIGISVFTVTFTGICLAYSGKEVRNGTLRIGDKAEIQFPFLARIDVNGAIKSATSAVKGKVLKVELENENDFLVYGVEIVSNSSVVDVKVDAGSGEVLVVEKDRPDGNDREDDSSDRNDD